MKNFEKFLFNFDENFENSNLYFFEFIIGGDLLNLQKNENNSEKNLDSTKQNQITDFLMQNFENQIKNHHGTIYEISKIKIDSEQILNDFEALKRKIEENFDLGGGLFEFENKKKITILNFFFQKELKNKNFEKFFEFLKRQFLQGGKKKFILILKETNCDGAESGAIERMFRNFIALIFKNNPNQSRENFGISEKKQLIEGFFEKNDLVFKNLIIKSKITSQLLAKNLFFIENDLQAFSLEFFDEKIDSSKFAKEILDSSGSYNIFDSLNLLLKGEEDFEKKFLFSLKKILAKEVNSILLIRSAIHFFLKNHLYFERRIGGVNFLEILEKCFDFEVRIKSPGFSILNQKSIESLQKNLFIKILSFF
jgi:hypothetical protein